MKSKYIILASLFLGAITIEQAEAKDFECPFPKAMSREDYNEHYRLNNDRDFEVIWKSPHIDYWPHETDTLAPTKDKGARTCTYKLPEAVYNLLILRKR